MPKRNEFLKAHYASSVQRIFTAAELVESCLNGSDYDRGELEEHRASIENLREAMGKLVQILYDKRNISRNDVYKIAGEFNPDSNALDE